MNNRIFIAKYIDVYFDAVELNENVCDVVVEFNGNLKKKKKENAWR